MLRTWVILSAPCWFCLTGCGVADEPTDYRRELTRISEEIAALAERSTATPEAARRLAFLHYARASLTGRFDDFTDTEDSIEKALENYESSRDLLLLRATLNYTLHRLDSADVDLQKAAAIASGPRIEIMYADIKLQRGQYDDARTGYQTALGRSRTWDALARLAYLEANTGNREHADRLYDEAGDSLSVKQLRAYAWIEVQKGLLDLQYARYEDALAHYERGNLAYSGYWLVEEHMAEVLHLLGRRREAVALYEKVVEKTDNAELVGALAAILEQTGDERAPELRRQAVQIFERQLGMYPEAVAGHIIRYALVTEEFDDRLLEQAELNHRARPNSEAKILLARSYLKSGMPDRARTIVDQVLATPWRTPELLALMVAAECTNVPIMDSGLSDFVATRKIPVTCR